MNSLSYVEKKVIANAIMKFKFKRYNFKNSNLGEIKRKLLKTYGLTYPPHHSFKRKDLLYINDFFKYFKKEWECNKENMKTYFYNIDNSVESQLLFNLMDKLIKNEYNN